MSLTREIKEFALDLGYTRVGITTADDFDDHLAEVAGRGDIYDFYVEDPRRFLDGARPREAMPGARSIICLAWDYAQKAFPAELVGKVGRIYQARCYNPPPHRINGARHRLLVRFLEERGLGVGRGIFIPERRAAARAGVARLGKNNFAYAGKSGSWVVLSSLVVDRKLEYDPPTLDSPCPAGCSACLEACPTGALYEPYRLDPRRCIAFNAWWTQDGRPRVSSHIPPAIREKMGARVHGCDLCQEACPKNAARLRARLPEDPFLTRLAREFSLVRMLAMDEEFRRRVVEPIMYNYITDQKYFQRNAAIALGNGRDPGQVPALARALGDPEELVRAYAAWALGRIGGGRARAALEAGLAREVSQTARDEMAAALARAV